MWRSRTATLSLATLGVTQAEIEGELHVGINTEYIFRGVDTAMNGAMGEGGLELNAEQWGLQWAAGIWYGSAQGDYGFDEVDYFASMTYEVSCFQLEVGYIYYDILDESDYAAELWFKGGVTVWQEVELAFAYYWDVAGGDNDGYSALTADKSFELSPCLDLGLNGTLSYDWEIAELHHVGLSASLDWAYNDVLTVSPYVSVTWAQNGAKIVGEYIYGPGYVQGDELFGGILVKASF